MCLLRDSYVELPAEEIEALFERTRAQLPDRPDAEASAQRFDLITLAPSGQGPRALPRRGRAPRRPPRTCVAAHHVRHLRAAARAAARRDPAFAPFADLIETLPETPCAP